MRDQALARWWLLRVALCLVPLAILWPLIREHLRAASLLVRFANPGAGSFLADLGVHKYVERELALPQTRARLYLPTDVDDPPGLVVVHGVHFKGIDEPRLLHFARTVASSGVAVLTPEVRALCDYRLDSESIDTIGQSAAALAQELKRRSVGVLGLSFAGGLALVAAADPRYRESFAFVTAVGAHDDLGRVLRFFISNETPLPDGTVFHATAHPYGPAVLVYSHVADFFSLQDQPVASEALRAWLHEDFDDARARAAALSPRGAIEVKHIFDRDTAAMSADLAAEINRLEPTFGAVSPSAHLAEIGVPVFLLHGADDTVIPPSETEWLARHTPAPLLGASLVSHALEHVELEKKGNLADKLALVNFMSSLLEACDGETRSAPSAH